MFTVTYKIEFLRKDWNGETWKELDFISFDSYELAKTLLEGFANKHLYRIVKHTREVV